MDFQIIVSGNIQPASDDVRLTNEQLEAAALQAVDNELQAAVGVGFEHDRADQTGIEITDVYLMQPQASSNRKWVCPNCHDSQMVSLEDMAEVGTPWCAECDRAMKLADEQPKMKAKDFKATRKLLAEIKTRTGDLGAMLGDVQAEKSELATMLYRRLLAIQKLIRQAKR